MYFNDGRRQRARESVSSVDPAWSRLIIPDAIAREATGDFTSMRCGADQSFSASVPCGVLNFRHAIRIGGGGEGRVHGDVAGRHWQRGRVHPAPARAEARDDESARIIAQNEYSHGCEFRFSTG
jgi:hypothetical protein